MISFGEKRDAAFPHRFPGSNPGSRNRDPLRLHRGHGDCLGRIRKPNSQPKTSIRITEENVINSDLQAMRAQLGAMGAQNVALVVDGYENPCVPRSFKCIECRRIKQEGNHWFIFSSDFGFSFRPFDSKEIVNSGSRLACSESCLFKQATKFIHREDKQ